MLDIARTVIVDMLEGVKPGLAIMRMPDGSLTVSADAQATFRTLRRTGDKESIIRSLIISACEKSEMIGMGSSRYLIRILSNILKLHADGIDIKTLGALSRSLKEELPNISLPPSQDTIDACLFDIVPDAAELVAETMKLAGSECKIFIEPSTTGTTVIERTTGNSFKVSPDPAFLKSGKWTGSDVRCLVVDGIVERVSEIDAYLMRCNETKRPMIIFARGYSDEVMATLRVNYARKTLNVIPVTVDFDLETVNVLIDIAMVLGCDVVSSLKGQLISSLKYETLPVAKEISCVGRTININVDINESLAVHLKNLIQKRNAEPIPTMRLILDRRIRSLSSSSVIVHVTDSGTRGSKMMHDIDAGLKVVRSVLQHGCIQHETLAKLNDHGILKDVVDTLCPTLSLGAGLHYAMSTAESICSSGALIENFKLVQYRGDG